LIVVKRAREKKRWLGERGDVGMYVMLQLRERKPDLSPWLRN